MITKELLSDVRALFLDGDNVDDSIFIIAVFII